MKISKKLIVLPFLVFSLTGCKNKEKTFTVTWKNYDGKVLEVDKNVKEGSTPKYDGATPTKASSLTEVYTFKSWDKKLTKVVKDVTYTATFSNAVRKYNVAFKDSDGETSLYEHEFDYGALPSFDGDTPTKADDGDYSFVFAGWDRSFEAVSGEGMFYTAVYLKVQLVGEVYYVDSLVGEFTELDLEIPETINGKNVAKIKAEAFKEKPLTSVTLPSTINEIQAEAFMGVTTLESIEIPASVLRIGNRAFKDCKYLFTLTLNEGVQTIGESAFEGSGIQELTLPASLDTLGSTNVGEYAFAKCWNLYLVTLNCGTNKFYSNSFSGCGSVTEVVSNKGDSSAGNLSTYCFRWYKTESEITDERGEFTKDEPVDETGELGRVYYKPYGYTSKYLVSSFGHGHSLSTGDAPRVKEYAFYNNLNVEKLVINKDCVWISSFAFDGCSAVTDFSFELGGDSAITRLGQAPFRKIAYAGVLTLPERIKNVYPDSYAFADLFNLTGFEMEDGVDDGYFRCEDGVLFSDYGNTVFSYPYKKAATSYTVAERVTNLNDYNGIQCNNLESINFASTTTLRLDSYVVGGNNITSVTFEPSVALTLDWHPFNNIPLVRNMVLPANTKCEHAVFAYLGSTSDKSLNIFYSGTSISTWNNDSSYWYEDKGTYCKVYVYSESDPGSTEALSHTEGYWHYVNDVPTAW